MPNDDAQESDPVTTETQQQQEQPAPTDEAVLEARASAAAKARVAIEEAREAQEREAAEEAIEDQARIARLKELFERNIAAAPKAADHPDGDATWTDPRKLQASNRLKYWTNDIREHHMDTLAAYSLNDVEDEAARSLMGRFVDNVKGKGPKLNLIVTGTVGTGKTSAAIAAGHYAVRTHDLSVRLVSHQSYLKTVSPSGILPEGMTKVSYLARYRSCDLLVLDDLAADHGRDVAGQVGAATEHVIRETLSLLNDRINTGKATIVTLNHSYDTVRAILGDRVASRLGQDAVAVKFVGEDRREPLRW